LAEELARRSDTGWAARWEHARAAIADARLHPRYAALELALQVDLDPLGPDPRSGLWEFAHMPSGNSPRRASDGGLVLEHDSAIVLVLVPGGRARLGALPARAGEAVGAHLDPHARGNEAPLREVELEPFFISKYELNQAQWLRAELVNPSNWSPGDYARGRAINALHPVEQVTWRAASAALARLGLELPTEAQWEYAARAATRGPWSFGARELAAIGHVNATGWRIEREIAPGARLETYDDGYEVHAPVDALAPNPNGLHHVHGNVWEWCRDAYWSNLRFELRPGDGLHLAPDENLRVLRGGSWCDGPHVSRSSFRNDAAPDHCSPCIGVRPVRRVEAVR
jgi:formylglycine-generating enzyme required for sulfatase activity